MRISKKDCPRNEDVESKLTGSGASRCRSSSESENAPSAIIPKSVTFKRSVPLSMETVDPASSTSLS